MSEKKEYSESGKIQNLSNFFDKLLANIGNFFITSLAGVTTVLFFDFIYGLLFSFLDNNKNLSVFVFSSWIWEKATTGNLKLAPEVWLLLFYAVVWSWGKVLYIFSFLLHDRLKGNYVIEGGCWGFLKTFCLEVRKKEIHHLTFEALKEKAIEMIEKEKILEGVTLTDYVLYYLLREIIPQKKAEKLKDVTKRALEFGFIGLSIFFSILLVGFFYSVALFEVSHCKGVVVFLLTLLLLFLSLCFTTRALRERYISRNFQLYLLFLLKDHLREDKKEDE